MNEHSTDQPNGRPARMNGGNGDCAHGCTTAQLRRFIKSRPYVPMHELRRRFELNGEADALTRIHTIDGSVFLGLEPRESRMIEDLVRQGEIGVDLCRDPIVPVVVGVFPMRPIGRS
jgi:hypothetical protein